MALKWHTAYQIRPRGRTDTCKKLLKTGDMDSGYTTVLLTILVTSDPNDLVKNGGVPTYSSKRMTPRDHRST
jgi:hypothetical protein